MSLAYLTRHQEERKKFYEDPLDTVESCVNKCEAPHEGKRARRQKLWMVRISPQADRGIRNAAIMETLSCPFLKASQGTSLVVQWLRLYTSNVGGTGSIPGQGTMIPHATSRGQKIILNKSKKVRMTHSKYFD